jgi:hypothetical protein
VLLSAEITKTNYHISENHFEVGTGSKIKWSQKFSVQFRPVWKFSTKYGLEWKFRAKSGLLSRE